MIDFTKYTAGEFVLYINGIFMAQKKRILEHNLIGKPEAFDMEYMQKSAEMNRVLRARSQKNPEHTPEEAEDAKRCCWAYAYWWNRTHMLEALAKSRAGNLHAKNDIERGATSLRKLVAGEKVETDLHPQFKNLIEKLRDLKPPGEVADRIFAEGEK